ncbi:MAG: YaaL family protein [Negativicutes bacterium]|nr:YaaL family protein [Negativicutes bacterium]
MRNIWPKKILAGLIDNDPIPVAPIQALPEAIEQARREWLNAQNYYNSVSDSDLVDHAVYLMQAAEKKYIYLLKKARREGVTSSPYS